MEAYTYKGISEGKYVEGEIEALNQEEASHKLKEQKVIITNLIRSKKKKGDAKAKAKARAEAKDEVDEELREEASNVEDYTVMGVTYDGNTGRPKNIPQDK